MHEYMTNFVDSIASSISEYGRSKNYNIPFSYYRKLAWQGLIEPLEIMLADYSDGYTEDDERMVNDIKEVIVNEYSNTNAKGKKCTN